MPRGVLRAVPSAPLGFLSVLMGIGGGSFGVPLMSLFSADPPGGRDRGRVRHLHAALGRAVPDGIGAGRAAADLGAVNLPAFLVVIAMTLVTTPVGVRLAHATDPKAAAADIRAVSGDRGAGTCCARRL